MIGILYVIYMCNIYGYIHKHRIIGKLHINLLTEFISSEDEGGIGLTMVVRSIAMYLRFHFYKWNIFMNYIIKVLTISYFFFTLLSVYIYIYS